MWQVLFYTSGHCLQAHKWIAVGFSPGVSACGDLMFPNDYLECRVCKWGCSCASKGEGKRMTSYMWQPLMNLSHLNITQIGEIFSVRQSKGGKIFPGAVLQGMYILVFI